MNKMVDFEMLADSVNIPDLLEDLGLTVLGPSGDSLKIECPNPLHVDKHPSCFFHENNMIWHCFGCHNSGTIIDIVENYKDIDRDSAKDYLNGLLGIAPEADCETIKERFTGNDLPDFQLSSSYRRDWENAGMEILSYVRRRKFNLLLFDKYGIGYNLRLNTLTLPVIYKRKIINIGERFLDPNAETKIKYKPDSPLSQNVWGIFEGYDNRDPFFTEGIFDAIRMREAGYNAYALLSNQLSKAKLRFLNEHFKGEFTIVPDNDKGGLDMIEAWKAQIHNSDVSIVEITEYKDIDEMPVAEIHKVVRSRKSLMELMVTEYKTQEEVCEGIGER